MENRYVNSEMGEFIPYNRKNSYKLLEEAALKWGLDRDRLKFSERSVNYNIWQLAFDNDGVRSIFNFGKYWFGRANAKGGIIYHPEKPPLEFRINDRSFEFRCAKPRLRRATEEEIGIQMGNLNCAKFFSFSGEIGYTFVKDLETGQFYILAPDNMELCSSNFRQDWIFARIEAEVEKAGILPRCTTKEMCNVDRRLMNHVLFHHRLEIYNWKRESINIQGVFCVFYPISRIFLREDWVKPNLFNPDNLHTILDEVIKDAFNMILGPFIKTKVELAILPLHLLPIEVDESEENDLPNDDGGIVP